MRKINILILFTLFTCQFILSQPRDFKALKDTTSFKIKLQEKAKKTTTIESNFTQEKNLSMLSEKITSKGHFCFKQPKLLRWEYFSPSAYLIVINAEKILIKDGKKVNKFDTKSNKMFKSINDMMLNSVQGNVLDHKEFKIAYFENETFYLVEMQPKSKDMKAYLKRIDMYFDKKDLSVAKLKMTELSDDYTFIEFTSRKINEAIPDAQFIVK